MQYFTVQARSHVEALDRMKNQYGAAARILSHRSVRMGGVLGFFGREGVEITGYISAADRRPVAAARVDLESEKKKILETATRDVRREETMQRILEEIKDLKGGLVAPRPPESHETVTRLREILATNEFTAGFIVRLIAELRARLSLADLDDFAAAARTTLEMIGDQLATHPGPRSVGRPAGRVLLCQGVRIFAGKTLGGSGSSKRSHQLCVS